MPSTRRTFLQSLAALGFLGSTARAAPPARERLYWTGRSGGFRWRFTSRDLTATRPGGGGFSLRKALFPKGRHLEGMGFYSSTATPLSLVGTVLSYREDDYWSGGAHPSGAISYASVDAVRPGRKLHLTDWFADAQVRDALWGDRIVRGALAKDGVNRKPATAKALVKALELKQFGGAEGMMYSFSGDLLSRFGFHHLEGDKVAVRLNVSWGAEIYRFQGTEIGLLLPVPAALRAGLRRAASGQEGFLARAARKRFKDRGAVLIEVGREGG